jgi:hypothetical protein
MAHLEGYAFCCDQSPISWWLKHQDRSVVIDPDTSSSREYLVPVTINLELEGRKYQDYFLYNIYGLSPLAFITGLISKILTRHDWPPGTEKDLTPEKIARILCNDAQPPLPSAFSKAISATIWQQVNSAVQLVPAPKTEILIPIAV